MNARETIHDLFRYGAVRPSEVNAALDAFRAEVLNEAANVADQYSSRATDRLIRLALESVAGELRSTAAAGQAPAPEPRRLDPDGRCHHCRRTPVRCDATGCGGRRAPEPQPETAPDAATVIPGPDTAGGPFVTLLAEQGTASVAPELTLARAAQVADELRAAAAEVDAARSALDADGLREWQLTRDNIGEIDDQIDADGIYAKGYWETVDGKLVVTGLRIGTGEDRIVARFGDTIVRHANGTYSVRPAEAGAS